MGVYFQAFKSCEPRQDSLCPAALVASAHAKCKVPGELVALDSGHFGLYDGAAFEEAVGAMVRFLTKNTAPR